MPTQHEDGGGSRNTGLVVKAPISIVDDLADEYDPPSSKFLSSGFLGSSELMAGSGAFDELQGSDRSDACVPISRKSVQTTTRRRQSFTLDRLRFSHLRLHGRAKEQEILSKCLQLAADTVAEDGDDSEESSMKQLVFVSGESGTGKTALTVSLIKTVRRKGGLFALGKYDLQHTSEPYLGLQIACEKLFMEMSAPSESEPSSTPTKLDAFRKDLLEELGDGVGLLMQVVPSIVKYILKELDRSDRYDSDSSEEFGKGGHLHEARAKLHFVFRALFRVICRHYAPVVLALDDLQWADAASLELIEELVSERDNRNLMLIGLYRSDEIHEASLAAKMIRGFRSQIDKRIFAMTEIEIGCISEEGVDGMITDLLSMDSSPATMALARICHKRTRGNVFFVIAFLRMLKDKGYLEYNFGSMKWAWDLSKIETETNATTNVVTLTKRKMATLKKEYQTILEIASCLGHRFEKNKLVIVAAGKIDCSGLEIEFIDEFLAFAVEEGFFEGPSTGVAMYYRWIHDSIQEAALSLMPSDALVKFKYEIGKSFLRELESRELESNVFIIVELLNDYAIQEGGLMDGEKEILAALNLRAAKRASKLSAYISVSKFAKIGISMLPEGHWTTHTQLSYGLYVMATEAEGTLMNEESMKSFGTAVLSQEHIPLFDKMRIYKAQLSFLGLGRQGRANEAVEVCLDALKQLGCHFPKSDFMRTMKLISNLMKHKKELPKRTAQEVASLPIMTDRRLREIDSILNELGIYAYVAGATTLSGLCTMEQTAMTLKHGFHQKSYEGFASLAPFFMVAFGDLKATDKVAQYSRHLKERAYGSKSVSGFCMMQGSFSLPWTNPWSTTLKCLLEGYEAGMRDGQLRDAIYCVSSYCSAGLFSGMRVDALREEIDIYVRHTSELNTGYPLTFILMIQRACNLLIDMDSRTQSLESGHTLVSEYEGIVKNDDYMMAMLNTFQGAVYYACSDFEKGSALAQKVGILLDKLLSHSANMPSIYHQCVALYATAQNTSKGSVRRKLKRLGIKRHGILKAWAKDSCINVVHYVAILDAELAALNGAKQKKVEGLYQKACMIATRGGFVQDAAVANERFGEYLERTGESTEAGRRYEQAAQYYEEWGFPRKSRLLREEKRDLLASWSIARGNSN